jgi:SAM-dependent methyltransferase
MIQDKIWNNFWKNKTQKPIIEVPPKILYGGTNEEPLASIGMSYFLEPIKNKFIDGICVLDYGCGAGILGNFISERLKNFFYYGLDTNSSHGNERLNLAKEYLNDERLYFGTIDENLKKVLNKKIDIIVLISVFTHLPVNEIHKILNNLKNVFKKNKNASIIFSCFISDEDKLIDYLPDIWDNFYGISFIKEKHLTDYCKQNNLNLKKHSIFVAANNHEHHIYEITYAGME